MADTIKLLDSYSDCYGNHVDDISRSDVLPGTLLC